MKITFESYCINKGFCYFCNVSHKCKLFFDQLLLVCCCCCFFFSRISYSLVITACVWINLLRWSASHFFFFFAILFHIITYPTTFFVSTFFFFIIYFNNIFLWKVPQKHTHTHTLKKSINNRALNLYHAVFCTNRTHTFHCGVNQFDLLKSLNQGVGFKFIDNFSYNFNGIEGGTIGWNEIKHKKWKKKKKNKCKTRKTLLNWSMSQWNKSHTKIFTQKTKIKNYHNAIIHLQSLCNVC